MSFWIKICGNTSLADARLALEAGADAVGFIFAPSPRQVTVAEAASIISRLPPAAEKIGVFVNAGVQEIYTTVRAAGLTGVQLHFAPHPDLPAKLRERLHPQLRILQVLHFEAGALPHLSQQVADYAHKPHIDGILVDSRTDSAVGGTGIPFDWAEARKTLFANTGNLKLIAAGGLNPANVAQAIATLRPWGVDTVSGVEKSPGKKDPIKVREFIENARAARSSV